MSEGTRGAVMVRREWAEQEAIKKYGNKGWHLPYAEGLQSEYARAVRIVGRAKALQFHGLRDTDTNEFLEGYEAACVDILAALMKGRA